MLRTLCRLQVPRTSQGPWSLGANFSTRDIPEADKSILQKEKEKKESWTPPDDEPVRKLTPREIRIQDDKMRLQWRKPLDANDKIWRSKFAAFNSNENDMSLMMLLQQPWDVSPKNLKRIYAEYKVNKEAHEQGFIEERFHILGPDLAVAHFITYRKGKIR